MKSFVYVVQSMNYGHCEGVVAVFSTEEKANNYAKEKQRKEPSNNFPVTPLILDEEYD